MSPTPSAPTPFIRRRGKQLATIGLTAALAVSLAACGGGEKKSAAGNNNSGSAGDFTKDGLYDPSKLVAKTEAGTETVDKVRWGLRTGEPATLDPIARFNAA